MEAAVPATASIRQSEFAVLLPGSDQTGTLVLAETIRRAVSTAAIPQSPAEEDPKGVSAELARALGRQLGVPVQFVIFHEAGEVSKVGTEDRWDVAFLAIDPHGPGLPAAIRRVRGALWGRGVCSRVMMARACGRCGVLPRAMLNLIRDQG